MKTAEELLAEGAALKNRRWPVPRIFETEVERLVQEQRPFVFIQDSSDLEIRAAVDAAELRILALLP